MQLAKRETVRDGKRTVPDFIDRAKLFELIIESATDFAIFTKDVDGAITSWSTGAEQIFGYPKAEIIGSNGDVICGREDRDAGLPDDERRRAYSEGQALDERWHQRQDGTRIWASGLLMPLRSGVQAIASQTIVNSGTLDEFREKFEGRLRALGRVQSLLAQVDLADVPLRTLIEAELSAHGNEAAPHGKIQITGPDMLLASPAAQTLALGLHELATNALKYGALAQPAGKLSVNCRSAGEEQARLGLLEWRESGVVIPQGEHARHRGYGTELLTRALPYQLKAPAELIFGADDGVSCTIAIPVKTRGRSHD